MPVQTQGNLISKSKYPKEFLDTWEGCSHLHCVPGCGSHGSAHCERLHLAFAAWSEKQDTPAKIQAFR